MMRFDILTLFPEMFNGPLNASILKRAQEAGLIQIRLYNIRDWAQDKHHLTDDYPYSGGAGMVMKPEPLYRAIQAVKAQGMERPGGDARAGDTEPDPPVILLSPQGRVFSQSVARELSRHRRLILVCGHYEGVDERVCQLAITDQISIGDYVLTGGELAAMVVVDAVSRLIPGVLGDEASAEEESFAGGLLEYPQYTRPPEFMGLKVPEVLLSGNHAEIQRWRRYQSLGRTWARRPDLLARAPLTPEERLWLARLEAGEVQAPQAGGCWQPPERRSRSKAGNKKPPQAVPPAGDAGREQGAPDSQGA